MKNQFNKFTDALMFLLFFSMFMLILGALTSCSPKIVLPKSDVPMPEWFAVDDPTEVAETAPNVDLTQWVQFQQMDGDLITISLDSLMNSDKLVIDTIWVAGEEVIVIDSIPCPPGLDQDSFVSFTLSRFLPARQLPVSLTVLDTVWLTKPCPTISANVASKDSGWPERIAWLLGVAALVFGYFRQWRKKDELKSA